MRTHVTGGRSHQVAVLKDFAEAAGRLHGAEQCKGRSWGVALEPKNPFQILPGQASAGTDQVFDFNLARRVDIAEFERWVNLNHGLIPLKLLRIYQAGQQQRGHALGVGGRHK
jgi:hypothetical protein